LLVKPPVKQFLQFSLLFRPSLQLYVTISAQNWPLEDWLWITSAEAQGALKAVMQSTQAGTPLLQLIQSLRREHSVERAAMLVHQAELRRAAAEKFPLAAEMFFTSKSLEQATDATIAYYKASRLEKFCDATIYELGCGTGGDLLAFMRGNQSRRIVAFEIEPATAQVARANVEACSKILSDGQLAANVAVRCEDFTQLDLTEWSRGKESAIWHIDPDRRPSGSRTTQWEFQNPSLEFMQKLWTTLPAGVIKGAPAAPLPENCPTDATREWISSRRECRQQVLWLGRTSFAPEKHVATRVWTNPTGAVESFSHIGIPGEKAESASEWKRYLYEPDPAVLAADLGGSLARDLELVQVIHDIPYFTADAMVSHPLLAGFEILEVLPWDLKRVKSLLAARNVGRIEIKKRGVDLLPEKIRPQLKLKGSEELTLFLTRHGEKIIAIVARRSAP
jgi:SAM-dependent methyltransferase